MLVSLCSVTITTYFTFSLLYLLFFCIYIYRPQQSWGKVIFSVACVKNSVHKGGGSTWAGTPRQVHPSAGTPQAGTPPGRYTPQAGTPLGRYTPDRYTPWAGNLPGLPGRHPPLSSACWEIWAASGRYASYWNAFLVVHYIHLECNSGTTGYVWSSMVLIGFRNGCEIVFFLSTCGNEKGPYSRIYPKMDSIKMFRRTIEILPRAHQFRDKTIDLFLSSRNFLAIIFSSMFMVNI